ncbi:MAG: tRNA lysidine(34) synthetase TilS [Muribaculaceae bacterium]|nr:tRNA lysidine(34) synthetase TilS [Muribaculaceae bacterium]
MKSNFLEKVETTIKKYGLLTPEKGHVIVALSGGPDSVALLDSLVRLGYNVVAAHCNFNLRGEESRRDEDFVRSLCGSKNIPLEIIVFDVEARRRQTGESVEMACRELRYGWFDILVEKYDAQALATGHHRDDNIETLLLNLLRTTGLRGVSGINPKGDRRVSPLIECSRDEIMNYLSMRRLGYVIDHTNNETEYRRNKVRNVIIPAIVSQFPDACERLAASISNLSDDLNLFDDAVNEWRIRYLTSDNTIDINELKRTHKTPSALLYRLLEPFGFNRNQATDIINNVTSGAKFMSNEYEAVISRGILRISKFNETEPPRKLKMTITDVADFKPLTNAGQATFDVSILDNDPKWEVRPWQQGDRIKPFGMNGKSKKLSDIFNDSKADDRVKRSSIVVTRNNEIVWVAGFRQSNLFRVDENTKQVVIISFSDDE